MDYGKLMEADANKWATECLSLRSELATAKARNRRMHEALDELIAACDETYDSKPYDVAMASARTALAEGAE